MWCGDLHALRYHAMDTYAVKYGALIYMRWVTCRRLLAAYSGTPKINPRKAKIMNEQDMYVPC